MIWGTILAFFLLEDRKLNIFKGEPFTCKYVLVNETTRIVSKAISASNLY